MNVSIIFYVLLLIEICYNLASIQSLVESHRFSRDISVENSGDAFENVDVFFIFNTEVLVENLKMNTNCSDILFTNSQNSPERHIVPHFISSGCNTPKTTIWIKVARINSGNNIFQMYYGQRNSEYFIDTIWDGHFFIMMNHSNGNIPSHMTLIDRKYNLKFMKGSNEFGNIQEHSGHAKHMINGVSGGYHRPNGYKFDFAVGGSGSGLSDPQDHVHPYSGSVYENDSLPPYYDVLLYESKEIFLPQNSIAMFEDISDMNQMGFIIMNEFNDRFPRVNNVEIITTKIGGNINHAHDYFVQVFSTEDTQHSLDDDCSSCGVSTSLNHIHVFVGTTVPASNIPPYVNILYGINLNENIDISQSKAGLIIACNELPPIGFDLLTQMNHKYPMGTNDELNVYETGGQQFHYHNYAMGYTSQSTDNLRHEGSGYDLSIREHDHLISGNTSESDLRIPHFSVIYAKQKDNPSGITIEIANIESEVPESSIYTAYEFLLENFYVVLGIFGSIALVISCLLICIVIITFVSMVINRERNKKIKKLKALSDFEELSQMTKEDEKKFANLTINKKLFSIQFEDLEVMEKIGNGGGGAIVMKAMHGKEIVAFKCFKTSDMLTRTHNFEEFERELALMSSLSHPNILQFYGAVLKPPRVGIVMEFCPFGDIKSLIERHLKENKKKIHYLNKVRFLLQISSGMNYLHSKNIIHRDLKCQNVLISKTREVKIMDFGLSKLIESETQSKTTRIGTSQYMAPEITLGNKYDEKIDVFAFGIMIHEIFRENFSPYEANNFSIELKVANDRNFRPKIFDNDFNSCPWIIELMKKCWSHSPSSRPSFSDIYEIISKRENIKEDNEEISVKEFESESSVKIMKLENEVKKLKERIKELEEGK